MLIGGVLVLGVIIRLLNTEPAVPVYPMSGAPVGDGQAPVVVTQPAARVATGSLSLLMPVDQSGEPMQVGPAAFPAGAAVVLSVVLPTNEPSAITVSLARLADDGSLQRAEPIAIDVLPDSDGMARVSTTVATLTSELGAGIYRVGLQWDGERIGGTDVALGLQQPSSVAIFSQPRRVSFAAGKYVGQRMDAKGQPVDTKPYTLGSASSAPAAAYAQFGGVPHALITAGIWAGYWIPLSDSATLQ